MKKANSLFFIFLAILISTPWSTLKAMSDNEWERLDLQFHSGHFYLATSELNAPGDNNLGPYGMHNLFDDSLHTCWAEGVKGPGIGESLYLDIKEGTTFINIANGYQKGPALFKANNRIKILKTIMFVGINLPGEVTELFTVYHARMFSKTGSLTLIDTSGFQKVSLPFDWESLLKFKEHTTSDFFAGRNIENENYQPDVRYILQLRIMDIYNGDKYNDTCISEIDTAMPEENTTVTNVYLNDAENTIFMDTKTDKGIILDGVQDAFFQLVELSPDKQWVIVIKMPAEAGGSRVETTYLLYNTMLKMRFTPELLGPDVSDLYDFTQKGDIIYLNYLNKKTSSVESIDLETVKKNFTGK